MGSSATRAVADNVHNDAGEHFQRYIATRDTTIVDALLAEHLDRSYSQAYRMLGNASDAEDAVQEAFLRVIRAADRFDGSVPFAAWLGRLVHNAVLQQMRSRRRRTRYEYLAGHQSNEVRNAPESEPAESALIRSVVCELPERFRISIDLHYFAGLSQRDTAKALGVSENAVAMRLHRAREYLKSLVKRHGLALGSAAIAVALESAPAYSAPAGMAVKASMLSAKLAASSAKFASLKVGSGFFALSAKSALIGVLAVSAGAVGTHLVLKEPASVKIQKRWTFDHGIPDDLIEKKPLKVTGTQKPLGFTAPAIHAGQALAVTFSVVVNGNWDYGSGAYWSDGVGIQPFVLNHVMDIRVLIDAPAGSRHVLTDYLVGNDVFRYCDGEFLAQVQFEREPTAEAMLFLYLNVASVDEISLRSIEPSELPSEAKTHRSTPPLRERGGTLGDIALRQIICEQFPPLMR